MLAKVVISAIENKIRVLMTTVLPAIAPLRRACVHVRSAAGAAAELVGEDCQERARVGDFARGLEGSSPEAVQAEEGYEYR
jgi:hypothetical protein